MQDSRVALCQIAPRLGAVDDNLQLHLDAVSTAKKDRADVVVFPELSLTGYVLRDQVSEVAMPTGHPVLEKLARESRTIDLLVGFVEDAPGHLFHNVAAYFSGGRLAHLHRKLYLPTYGLFQEGRDLAAGCRLRRFDSRFGPAGILICEDLWHPTSAWLLAQQGAETIYVLSNGPTRGARPGRGVTSVEVWRDLLRVTAEFQTSYLVYVNRVGCEDGLTFGGGSTVVDPFGRVVAELPALDETTTVVELEDEVLRRARVAYPLLRDARVDLVQRELERARRVRYDLPLDEDDLPGSDESAMPGERP